jgi:hypothetical protein
VRSCHATDTRRSHPHPLGFGHIKCTDSSPWLASQPVWKPICQHHGLVNYPLRSTLLRVDILGESLFNLSVGCEEGAPGKHRW